MSTEHADIAGVAPRTKRATTVPAAIVCESTACLPDELVRRYQIGIVPNARAEEEADQLMERVGREFDCAELYTTEFTPVMGGYAGPGLLGLAFYAEVPSGEQH